MKTNKKMRGAKLILLRWLTLDSLLRNKSYISKDYIKEINIAKFGVRSASTIEKDLGALILEFNAPIKYSRYNNGYFYTKPFFLADAMNDYYFKTTK